MTRIGEPALELRRVDVGYRQRRSQRTVCGEIDACAAAGELTVVIGTNGSGKSTLLRTLAGLQPPLGGTVLLNGAPLAELDHRARARALSVVLADRDIPPLLTAREVVGLGRLPHSGPLGTLDEADRHRVGEALGALGADPTADRLLTELSDGERQRVMIARALAQDPRLLVLDEPTAFLDVGSRVSLLALLRELARTRGLAVLASTHDLELALRVADQVWLIDRGRLTTGTPEELAGAGAVNAAFDCRALAFDPLTGGFRLQLAPTGSARVHAPAPSRPALERLLAREGWTVNETGPTDLTISQIPADGWTLTGADGRSRAPDLTALARALRGRAPGLLRCADPAEVAAALADSATIGPYFSAEGPAGHDAQAPAFALADLIADPVARRAALDRIRTRLGPVEPRVVASMLMFDIAARTWSVTLALAAGYGIALAEIPTRVRLHPSSPPTLDCPEPVGWVRTPAPNPATPQHPGTPSDPLAAVLHREVVTQFLDPLVDALARTDRAVAAGLLWGNAVSAMVGAHNVLVRARPDTASAAGALAHALLAAEPRLAHAGTMQEVTVPDQMPDRDRAPGLAAAQPAGGAPVLRLRRRSCCLYYRTPARAYCGDCPLTSRAG